MASSNQGPRIALVTPYNGGNLGDAAIQDALIYNLRERLPDAEFSGITLNSDNFIKRHGVAAFPLVGNDREMYAMARGYIETGADHPEKDAGILTKRGLNINPLKTTLLLVPFLGKWMKAVYRLGSGVWRELRHWVEGYLFLRKQDILIVSGGGQLDEEWSGPWGHPFALFKWAVLARMAGIPCAVVSVGACKVKSRLARLFLSSVLRLSRYRSYRDKNSRMVAASLLKSAAGDPIVPDLAFSLRTSMLPKPASIRALSQGRTIVAISPIAFSKPHHWPSQNQSLYDHYIKQMALVVGLLIERGYFLVIVWSSLGDDQSVIPDILELLDEESLKKLQDQLHIPAISKWQEFVAAVEGVDFLIASRLHSTILGLVSKTPTIAISFDPKVDWAMEDLGQLDYLFQIRDFEATDVLAALDRINCSRDAVLEKARAYLDRVPSACDVQFDALAEVALAGTNSSR